MLLSKNHCEALERAKCDQLAREIAYRRELEAKTEEAEKEEV
jgi:hypothetical protein